MEQDVFEELLTFIYTGKAPNISKTADVLLPVADKVSFSIQFVSMDCV